MGANPVKVILKKELAGAKYFRCLSHRLSSPNLLESHRLWGTGLGWIDLHLLASAALFVWTMLTSNRVVNRTAQAPRLDR
jgi:hypothetical protein